MVQTKDEVLIKYTLLGIGMETGLGSILHAYRIPFSGHFLSLNQGFILSKAAQNQKGSEAQKSKVTLQVSTIVALMKSFSPAGKRLTPMLAISMQGFLFSFGYRLLTGRAGTILGICLMSLWTTIQPFLIYYLVFGNTLIEVGQYYLKKLQQIIPITHEHLLWGVILMGSAHLLLAFITAIFSFSKKSQVYESKLEQLSKSYRPTLVLNKEKLTITKKVQFVLKDMLSPWFLGPIILIATFFITHEPMSVQLVWKILRPIAMGFVVFYALRFLPLDKYLLKFIDPKGATGLALIKVFATLRK